MHRKIKGRGRFQFFKNNWIITVGFLFLSISGYSANQTLNPFSQIFPFERGYWMPLESPLLNRTIFQQRIQYIAASNHYQICQVAFQTGKNQGRYIQGVVDDIEKEFKVELRQPNLMILPIESYSKLKLIFSTNESYSFNFDTGLWDEVLAEEWRLNPGDWITAMQFNTHPRTKREFSNLHGQLRKAKIQHDIEKTVVFERKIKELMSSTNQLTLGGINQNDPSEYFFVFNKEGVMQTILHLVSNTVIERVDTVLKDEEIVFPNSEAIGQKKTLEEWKAHIISEDIPVIRCEGSESKQIIVTLVSSDSPAWESGLREADQILQINGKDINSYSLPDLKQEVSKTSQHFLIERKGETNSFFISKDHNNETTNIDLQTQ